MTEGRIILLNGASSSGKSTIAKELQSLLKDPHMHLGIDTVFGMIPPKCKCRYPSRLQAFTWVPMHKNAPEVGITVSPLGHKIIRGFHRACATFCESGLNLIIDHVLLDRTWSNACYELFSPFEFHFIGVLCSIEMLEKRERERGDRQIGLARFTALHVHEGNTYDMTVDTELWSPGECAKIIIRHISSARVQGIRSPAAFLEHWSQRSSHQPISRN